jgi:hypothetical protein
VDIKKLMTNRATLQVDDGFLFQGWAYAKSEAENIIGSSIPMLPSAELVHWAYRFSRTG